MFSERLKFLRKQNKVTQEILADKVGVERSSIGKYETSNVVPSTEVLIKIAEYFDVSTDYLLGRDENQHVNDDEALEYLDELHKRPEMKTLFDVSRKATKKDVEAAVAVIEALKKQSGHED